MSPVIPRFESDIIAQPARGRVEASQLVPHALAALGQQGQRVAGLLAEAEILKADNRNAIEARTREAEFETELHERILEFESQPDPATHSLKVAEAAQEIAKRHLSEASTPAVKERLVPRLRELGLTRFRESRRYETKILSDQGRAAVLSQLDRRHRAAVEAPDPRDAEAELQAGVEALSEAQGLGLWKAEEIFGMSERFRKAVRIGRAEQELYVDPAGFLERLVGPEFQDLSSEERLTLNKRAEARIVFLDERRRVQAAEEERLEKKQHRTLSQEFIRRSIAGEDVTRHLMDRAQDLGDEFDNTFNSVRALQTARARGDLFASTPSVVQEYDRRLRGVGDPLLAQEVVGASDAGALNASDTNRLLTAIQERDQREPRSAMERAALTDAEQFIRRGLIIKVPGVDRMTGADNERQNSAVNLATIEFYDLEESARRQGQPFDARRVAQSLVEKWRNFLVPEAVQEGALFGSKTFEDAELEIARRVRIGRVSEDEARFLLRVAEAMLPRKPKPKPTSTGAEEFTPIITP
ncbi:MAG: hypothetical protein ACT4PO_06810 [Actinomycetota bacterium]